MERDDLLKSYLRQLRLPSFVRSYQSSLRMHARNNLDYTRYLLALAEQEVDNTSKTACKNGSRLPAFRCSKNWRISTFLPCQPSTKPRCWTYPEVNTSANEIDCVHWQPWPG